MSKNNLLDRYAAARRTLEAAGHEHALKFFHDLDPDDQDALLEQIEGVDWPEVTRLIETHVRTKPVFKLPENVQPAPWYPYSPTPELKTKYQQARRLGEDLIRAGKVAAFTVAGGQGTRLGWDGPKGSFPATPIRGLSLFGCMAEFILKTKKKYTAKVPWYIMTSPANDGDTRAFFEEHNYFGLPPADVMFFPQGMMPAIAPIPGGGRVLLEAPHSLALSPNGHGGSLKALYTSGAIADMKKRGIEEISYTQVDNPIVKVIDPLFLGLHALDRCEMSSKMLPKREPMEKLGNFCLVDGKMTVIEYSDLPESLAHERLPGGELRFKAGSIAIHAIRVDFVESLNSSKGFGLPFHRADKKVPCLDPHTGEPIEPTKPNAVKLETFVFDALPLTKRSIIYETDRIEEFAPIKNADGDAPGTAVDCPATSKEIQIERAARWLEKNGVKVPRDAAGKVDAVVEISHLTGVEAEDLKGVTLPGEVTAGARVLL